MWKPKTEKGKRKSLARLFTTLLGKVETGVGEDNLVGTIEGADGTLESLFRHGEARGNGFGRRFVGEGQKSFGRGLQFF